MTKGIKSCLSLGKWLFLAVLVSSCGTVKVAMQVTHPAEINMNSYKQVALSDMQGNVGLAFSDAIKNQLIESGRFQVVERSRLDQIMKELNLSQSDLSDATNRAKLGKLMSASAMIAGHVNGNYDEKLTKETQKCHNYEKDYDYQCTAYFRKGIYRTTGSVDVVDIQTGQILKSRLMNANIEKTTSAYDVLPETIDKDVLAGQALNQNVSSFMKAISPWKETVQAAFETDSDIPELERGVNIAKMGDIKESISVFANAAKSAEENAKIKPKTIAKAYWDLGLAYEYTDEFDKAIEAFKKAQSLEGSDAYIQEKRHAENLKNEKKKLTEQGL